jgi:signal transduction histidine kinase
VASVIGWPMLDEPMLDEPMVDAPMVDEPTSIDTPERTASETDAHLVRGVRLRLVAWSGGSTLLVLLGLGIALYLSVASSLQATAVANLEQRAGNIIAYNQGVRPDGDDDPTAFIFGDSAFAILIRPDGTAVGPRGFPIPVGLPDTAAATAAGTSGHDVRLSTITIRSPGGQSASVPVRQLTVPAESTAGRYFVQVVQDRSAEVRTLESLILVLILGGLLVIVVAVGFGTLYANRALVPIRESLAGQRASLRRQREFAADASHELRTPLTVIRSSVEYLRRHGDQPVATVEDALLDIDAEVEHLTTLVGDLLLLARSDSGAVNLDRVPLHLDDIAADAAASFEQPAAAAGVRLEVDPQPTPTIGDPARLRQLVMILVDNAIRHSPRDATVRVVVRPAASGAATLAIEDAGPGVAPEDRQRVFDRFWRAPGAPVGGTGLGLAIAKWIAEHHDGTISVDRSDAGGARFEVRLAAGHPAPELESAG